MAKIDDSQTTTPRYLKPAYTDVNYVAAPMLTCVSLDLPICLTLAYKGEIQRPQGQLVRAVKEVKIFRD